MASLDNFHRNNTGVRSHLGVRPAPWDGSSYGQVLQQRDVGGVPGRWDPINRAPVATAAIRRADPFSRLSLGRDVPGQEWRTAGNPFQTNPFVPLGPEHTIKPGGTPESWVLYQNRHPQSWSLKQLLPLKW